MVSEQELSLIPCTYPPDAGKSKGIAPPRPGEEQLRGPEDLSGRILRKRTIGPFTVSEHVYSDGAGLPNHSHRHALLTFVVEGTFREHYEDRTIVCRPGALHFVPAGQVHSDEFETNVRSLHVAMSRDVLDGLDRRSVVPRKPVEVSGLSATWLANRLYAEFSQADKASSIAMEGLVLEILAEIARSQTQQDPILVPRWLRQATEIVESRFLERLTLAEIAAQVGVHYVHLSRQFHKYNRCTIGEMIRRRRIQYASHLLAHSSTPLAEIALICGFSDQSHLSFLFKRYMGVSPSRFRTMAGNRSDHEFQSKREKRADVEPIHRRQLSTVGGHA
jgi:AraC family transcriptional regulator